MNRHNNRKLSEKEQLIIYHLSLGLQNKEIALEVVSTENVVKNYLRVIYDKLGMHNWVELALWYVSRAIHDNS